MRLLSLLLLLLRLLQHANAVDGRIVGLLLQFPRFVEVFVAFDGGFVEVESVELCCKMLSHFGWHGLQEDLLADVVDGDVGGLFEDVRCQLCRSAGISRVSIEKRVNFLLNRFAVFVSQVAEERRPSAVCLRAVEKGIDLCVVF